MSRKSSSSPASGGEPSGIDLGKEFENMSSDNIFTGHLDRNSKSLLFLLAVSAFNEWEKEFLNDYRTLIEYRLTYGIGRGSCNADSTTLYTLMKGAVNGKCEVLNPESKTDFANGSSNNYINFAIQTRASILRRAVQVYRIDIFLKVLLIIFLLKLPSFCYILSVVCYILYCCGAVTLWLRVYRYARASPAVGEFLQANQALVTRVQGYMQQLMNPIQPMRPQNNAPRADSSQQQGNSGNAEHAAPSAGSDTSGDNAQKSNDTIKVTTANASDETAQPRSQSIIDEAQDKLVDGGAANDAHGQGNGQQVNVNEEITTDGQQTLKQQQPEELQSQPQSPSQVEETQTDTTRPVPLHNALYQVVVAFALSMLPWCDTSNF